MTLYEKYKQSKIDFSLVGLERRDTNSDYFCTPEGAEIIGWTGVDGIHYCFIEGFQEVFSVSPMAIDGEYVHPVAKDFPDFLRLLLACRSEAAIEQAYGWSREQFESFLAENPASGSCVKADGKGILPYAAGRPLWLYQRIADRFQLRSYPL